MNAAVQRILVSYFLFTMPICFAAATSADQVQQNDLAYMKEQFKEWSNQPITSIAAIKGGWSGARLYEITFGQEQKPYVARLLTGRFAKEKSWQDAEIAAVIAAEEAGVGPYIRAARSKSERHPIGYIVMQKINASPMSEVKWDEKETYRCLGGFLRKMHDQKSMIEVDKSAIFERFHGDVKKIKEEWQKKGSDGLFDQLARVEDFFNKVRPIWELEGRMQLVHSDILGGNLLWNKKDNRYYIIDLEQSMQVPTPLYDVATVYDGLVPKKYQKEFLKDGYQLSAKDRKMLLLMRCMANCFLGLAYAPISPVEFAFKVKKYTQEKVDPNSALTSFMHDGFKRNTLDSCMTFAALFFMQGYRWLEGKKAEKIEEILDAEKKHTHVSGAILDLPTDELFCL